MDRKQNRIEDSDTEYNAYFAGMSEEYETCYIQSRVIKQIDWYDKSAVKYKKWYQLLNVASILLTCTLPCLTTLDVRKLVIALVSTASVIITTLANAFDCHNLWIEYRMICERLKSNLHQYMTGTGIYASIPKKNQFITFANISEECMSKEQNYWNSINNAKERTNCEEKES